MVKPAFFVALALLAGCAGQGRMPVVNQFDAKYSPWASAEAVSSVTFQRPGSAGDIAPCVAEVVSNQGETLSDSSGSFFGAYTGNYYSFEKSTQAAGGSVIEYVAPDASSVVASGSTRYSASSLVSRSVRFKLAVEQDAAERTYRYSSLGQAQLDSGVVANTGYGPIGSFAGANPDLALQALDQLTNNIEKCLAR